MPEPRGCFVRLRQPTPSGTEVALVELDAPYPQAADTPSELDGVLQVVLAPRHTGASLFNGGERRVAVHVCPLPREYEGRTFDPSQLVSTEWGAVYGTRPKGI